jgi:hypothetical protein
MGKEGEGDGDQKCASSKFFLLADSTVFLSCCCYLYCQLGFQSVLLFGHSLNTWPLAWLSIVQRAQLWDLMVNTCIKVVFKNYLQQHPKYATSWNILTLRIGSPCYISNLSVVTKYLR